VLGVARWRFQLEPIGLAKAHHLLRSCILCRRDVHRVGTQTTLSSEKNDTPTTLDANRSSA
jgi:hypothetical protein